MKYNSVVQPDDKFTVYNSTDLNDDAYDFRYLSLGRIPAIPGVEGGAILYTINKHKMSSLTGGNVWFWEGGFPPPNDSLNLSLLAVFAGYYDNHRIHKELCCFDSSL